ncbi:tetraspanin Tsp2 [Circinella umbellata]|nr:tetraspanin Tsp2 [Circinella umbellata]
MDQQNLPRPVLPWIASTDNVNRGPTASTLSHSSLSSTTPTSVHLMKHYVQDHNAERKMRWSTFKWWIILSNTLLFCYGLGILLLAILTFGKFYLRADVFIVGQKTLLNLTGTLCVFTALVGYVGIILNNRTVLTCYNLLLWVTFAMVASIGYVSYRKNKWNIDGKLSYQWHYDLTSNGRTRIQANLHCCGYKEFTDFHEKSSLCFPRTILPGCRFKYTQFTRQALSTCFIAAFSIVPAHLFVMVSAILCSNHVNRRFGKGLPPKIYRLDYRGIVAGTPTGSTHNLFNDGISQRPPSHGPA